MGAGDGKKKREILGPPPLGAPSLRDPIFLGLGPTLWAMTHTPDPEMDWPKLAKPRCQKWIGHRLAKIGQIRMAKTGSVLQPHSCATTMSRVEFRTGDETYPTHTTCSAAAAKAATEAVAASAAAVARGTMNTVELVVVFLLRKISHCAFSMDMRWSMQVLRTPSLRLVFEEHHCTSSHFGSRAQTGVLWVVVCQRCLWSLRQRERVRATRAQ